MNLYTALAALSTFALSGCVSQDAALIDEKDAVEAALTKFSGEVLGVRFDEPDRQWDVFIKTKDQAYEVEVDAVSGKIVAAEKESLEEIQAELSGDLSHEGVDGDVDP
ncbi:MAG: PepSY domain-containing protein [Planctomycetota bacterium]